MQNAPIVVRVYSGLGASKENCCILVKRLSSVLCRENCVVSTITPEETMKGDWRDNTDVYVIGGGYDLGFIEALGQKGVYNIKKFVLNGGKYLGICAGAYFACDAIEFDKGGPQDVCGERHLNFFPGLCIGPVYGPYSYNTKFGAEATEIKYGGSNESQIGHTEVRNTKVYYNGGGMFVTNEKFSSCRVMKSSIIYDKYLCASIGTDLQEKLMTKHILHLTQENCDENPEKHFQKSGKGTVNGVIQKREFMELGCFSNIPGQPMASVGCTVGHGKAVLTGIHPEYYPEDLQEDDPFIIPVRESLVEFETDIKSYFSYLLKYLDLNI